MRVSIDSATCQGHGRCYDLAPDLFGEDEEGYAVLTDLTADDESALAVTDDRLGLGEDAVEVYKRNVLILAIAGWAADQVLDR